MRPPPWEETKVLTIWALVFLKATGSDGRVLVHSYMTDPTVVINLLPSLAILSKARCIPSAINSTYEINRKIVISIANFEFSKLRR